jgi:hypothetical protein
MKYIVSFSFLVILVANHALSMSAESNPIKAVIEQATELAKQQRELEWCLRNTKFDYVRIGLPELKTKVEAMKTSFEALPPLVKARDRLQLLFRISKLQKELSEIKWHERVPAGKTTKLARRRIINIEIDLYKKLLKKSNPIWAL